MNCAPQDEVAVLRYIGLTLRTPQQKCAPHDYDFGILRIQIIVA